MSSMAKTSLSVRAGQPPASPRWTHMGDVIHHDNRDCGSMTTRKADSLRGFFPHTFTFPDARFMDSPTASATGSSGADSPATPPTPAAGMMAMSTMTMSTFDYSVGSKSPADDSPAPDRVHGRVADSPASAAPSGHSSAHIDHTALLLGFVDESCHEGSDDDEREWNATFSLDELEGRARSGGADDVGMDDAHEGRGIGEDDGVCEYRFGNNETCGDGFDFRGVSLEDAAATYSHDEHKDHGRLLVASTTQQPQQKPPRPIAQVHPAAYLRTSSSDTKQSRTPTTPRSSYNGIKQLSTTWPIGSDAWSKEEEDKKTYFDNTPRLKKYDSFEHKKKMATMKALAMKERASSALASKANRAKEKVKEKIIKKHSSLSESSFVRSTVQQQDLHQGLRERLDQPNGMEITTKDHDDIDVLSQVSEVSNGFSADKNPYASVTESFKSKLSLSRAKLSRETNNMKSSLLSSSKVSQIASAKLKSSKSAVLDMIKDPLLRNVDVENAQELKMDTTTVIAATSTTGSTSSMANRTPGKNMAIKTRLRVEVPPNVKEEDVLVLSMDGDFLSNVPNSEGTSSFRHDVDCLEIAGMSSRLAHTIVEPHNTFSTPRATTSKNGNRSTYSQVRSIIDADITPPKNNLTRNAAHHGLLLPMSTPHIATCLSNSSSHTGGISCIDSNGFLISPNASIDHGWDETASATLGSEGTFDPNSFLFLSPLSNHDFDDPDHGMPELLSRSNSRNAVVLDKVDPPPGPPEDAKSTASMMTLLSPTKALSKRLSRLPPSPRLLPLSPQKLSPSGKTIMKTMKIVGKKISVGPKKTSPIHHRSFTSTC